MDPQTKHSYEFGPFHVDAANYLLLRDGQIVPLKPKVLDALVALLENRGRVLGKDVLMQMLWPDSFVEEANLTQTIYMLRKALGEGPNEHNYIETIPKRGYRFVASVREFEGAGGDLAARERASAIVKGEQGIESIAVLPFKPMMAASRDESLELGMADTVIMRLSNIRQLTVRPTSAVRKYTGLDQDPLAAGREQRVDAVLESSIQRSGQKVRVTARLLNVQDGLAFWTFSCDEMCTDIFELQDAISEKMAAALALKLNGEERKLLTKRYTENTDAYQAYLKGRYYWNKRTEEGFKRAIQYFQQAIDIDPNYALAYSGLADSYILLVDYFGLLKESYPKAKIAATKALEIDEALAEAHTSLAFIRCWYDWDWSEAENEYKRAIQLNPNYPTAHHWYSRYLIVMGRMGEAGAEIKRAQELDPLSLIINSGLGEYFYFAHQYDQAIEQLRKTLDMDPSFVRALLDLGQAYVQKGMYDQAIAEYRKAITLSGGSAEAQAWLGYAYAVAGKRGEAQKVLADLSELLTQRPVAPYWKAMLYAGLGKESQALAWLEKAYQERFTRLALANVQPEFDTLRSDPRLADLLRRMGLAQ
jgi:DNA-binding winged helix-turn-helix (wHTH) protein/Tfp pilus assembly protein PilF